MNTPNVPSHEIALFDSKEIAKLIQAQDGEGLLTLLQLKFNLRNGRLPKLTDLEKVTLPRVLMGFAVMDRMITPSDLAASYSMPDLSQDAIDILGEAIHFVNKGKEFIVEDVQTRTHGKVGKIL